MTRHYLYSDAETLSADFDQGYATLDDGNLQFKLDLDGDDTKKVTKADYIFNVRADGVTGSSDTVFKDFAYTFRLICGAKTIVPRSI